MTMLPLILFLAVSSARPFTLVTATATEDSAASARPFTLVAVTTTEDSPFSGTTDTTGTAALPPFSTGSPDNLTFSPMLVETPFSYPPSTLFLPTMETGSNTFPSPEDTCLLDYHTVPERLTYQQLSHKKGGTLLPTLLPGRSIEVTSTSTSPAVELDGVQVTHPDLFVSELLVIHGVYRPLHCSAPASKGKREKIKTISLSVAAAIRWLGFLVITFRKAWNKYYGVPAVQDQYQGPRHASPTPNAYDHVIM